VNTTTPCGYFTVDFDALSGDNDHVEMNKKYRNKATLQVIIAQTQTE